MPFNCAPPFPEATTLTLTLTIVPEFRIFRFREARFRLQVLKVLPGTARPPPPGEGGATFLQLWIPLGGFCGVFIALCVSLWSCFTVALLFTRGGFLVSFRDRSSRNRPTGGRKFSGGKKLYGRSLYKESYESAIFLGFLRNTLTY